MVHCDFPTRRIVQVPLCEQSDDHIASCSCDCSRGFGSSPVGLSTGYYMYILFPKRGLFANDFEWCWSHDFIPMMRITLGMVLSLRVNLDEPELFNSNASWNLSSWTFWREIMLRLQKPPRIFNDQPYVDVGTRTKYELVESRLYCVALVAK